MADQHMENSSRSLIAIIGGGAAGLTAAVAAINRLKSFSETQLNSIRSRYHFDSLVTVLEKNDRVGKKILATGNGRCNLSHQNLSLKSYHGHQVEFARNALSFMNTAKTLDWFSQIGIPAKTESDGRVFPNSLQAASVLDNLRFEADRLQVKIITHFNVTAVKPGQPLFIGSRALEAAPGFVVTADDGRIVKAGSVIVAAGGMAGPAFGSDGSGYSLFEDIGHTTTPLLPALVQIKTETAWSGGLSGSKFEGKASFCLEGVHRRSEQGEILFTRYGLSGPPILQLSRLAAAASENKQLDKASIELNFLPEWDDNQLRSWLKRRAGHSPELLLSDYLTGLLPKKIGQALLKQALKQPLSQKCMSLDNSQIDLIVYALLQTRLPVSGTLGWEQAQVTAGGLDVRQFNPATLESTLQPGLFAAGEILDIDGDCGGYNLQWAWSSGHLAGVMAAEKVSQTESEADKVDYPLVSHESRQKKMANLPDQTSSQKSSGEKSGKRQKKTRKRSADSNQLAAGKDRHNKTDRSSRRQKP